MGRQTAVALSQEDEGAFLSFLRAEANIRIYRWAAAAPELLLVPLFPPCAPGESSFRLWNTAFPWEPEYGQWQSDTVQALELAEKFYLTNTAGAPLLE
jgi:hypothetical protein